MVAEADVVVCKNCVIVSEVHRLGSGNDHGHQCQVVGDFGSPNLIRVPASEKDSTSEKMDCKSKNQVSYFALAPPDRYFPTICSGSYANIGHRPYMEDKHVQMDHLASHVEGLLKFAHPSAFYAVFDGHGGADAANFMAKNAKRLFFEDVDFPNSREVDDGFVSEVGNSLRRSFLLADQALAEESSASCSSGTTALTALVLGSLLMVANVGDCRAVLCRGGEAIDMSTDHRPSHPSERKRVEDTGGFIMDGYLNGVLSVTRALGDWDLKSLHGSHSPLISEPEIKHTILTEKDEFLIVGCDGIWDVMSSQQAVTYVRRGLRRHGEADKCARDLVKEALRKNAFDNLTVIVVCFSKIDLDDLSPPRRRKMGCWSLSIL